MFAKIVNCKLRITNYKFNNLILVIFFIVGLNFLSQNNISAQTNNNPGPTAQSYFLEGNLLFNQGKDEEAIKKFKKALKLDANMSQAYYNIGVVYQQKGSTYYNLAIKWYKEALKKNNKLINSYYNLGVIYFDLGDYKGALKQFEIARQLSPQDKSITDALRATKKMIAKSKEEKKQSEEEKNKNEQKNVSKNQQKIDTTKQQQPTQNKNQTNIKNKTENKKISIQTSQQKSTTTNNKQQTSTNQKTRLVQKTLTPTVKANQKNQNTKTITKPNTLVLPQVKIKNVPPQKFQVAKIVTCKNVVNKNPIKETNLFSSKDKEVYLWINFSNLNKKHNVNTKWYSPEGKVFFSTSGAINPAGGRYRYWVSKKLAKTATANLKGKWKVEVLLDNQKVGETEFQIGN